MIVQAQGHWFKSPMRAFLTEHTAGELSTLEGFESIADAADKALVSVLVEDYHRMEAEAA